MWKKALKISISITSCFTLSHGEISDSVLAENLRVVLPTPLKVEISKVPFDSIDTIPTPYDKAILQESRRMGDIAESSAWAAYGGTALGFLALIISIITAYHASGQSKIQMRAYLDARIDWDKIEVVKDGRGSNVSIPVYFKNVGQTPAFNCSATLTLSREQLLPLRKEPYIGKWTQEGRIWIEDIWSIGTISVGESSLQSFDQAISRTDLSEGIQEPGKNRFTLSVVVKYRDIFKRTHIDKLSWAIGGLEDMMVNPLVNPEQPDPFLPTVG